MEEKEAMLCCSLPSSKEDLNKVFVCSEEGCSSRFSKRSYLEQHMCIHTIERPFVCPNEGCNKSYKRKDHLNRHMKLCPTSSPNNINNNTELAQPSSCTTEVCEQHEFVNVDDLNKQVRISHTTKKTFPCTFDGCSQVFKKHQELRAHEFDHTQKNHFLCSHPGCEMSFRWMNRLKRHLKVHEGYSCPECGERFEKWTLLLKHKSSAHQKQLTCSMCMKTFTHLHRLNIHMKVHSEEREVYECPRDGCVRYYSERRNLDAHIRSYHDGQRFPCTHEGCERTFAFKHKMLEHLKSHLVARKIKKKFPKKAHRKKNIASMLTGIKNEDPTGVKELSDSDDLLPLSSNETESFSVTPSYDWGGYSEILNVSNPRKLQESDVYAPKTMEIPEEDSDHRDLGNLVEDHFQATIIDTEQHKDKITHDGCEDNPVQTIDYNVSALKPQANSIHLLDRPNLSDTCLLTDTSPEREIRKSPQIRNDCFTVTSSSDSHLQGSQNAEHISVTLNVSSDESQESDHSYNFAAPDHPEIINSDNRQQIPDIELGPTDNLFKCSSCAKIFLSEPLLKCHQKHHVTEPQSFICPRNNCQKIYTVKRRLDLHLKCDHDGLGFQCLYANCGRLFDSQRSLDRHLKLHKVKMRQRKKKRMAGIISENVAF